MADLDDSEVFRSSDLQENPDQVALKFLRGGYSRLVQTTAILTQKSDSMEVMLTELQKTISQLSNQLGKRPIAGESSHHNSPVTHSDTYVRDDLNRLPMDNRKSLLRKIEMPKFDGSNAYDWLSKVERFFRVGRYSDFDKLDLVALSLEGDVLKWFNWEMTRREFHSWEEFRQRLFSRFGAAPEESPGNRLFAIKQTGTISAYVTQFEELSAQVVGLSDSHLEQIFYNGLKTEMKEVLKLKDPIGLENQKTAVLRMETSSFCHMLSDQLSYSEDDYELTESKIKAFLDEKAANLKKLQTPLYEEYYNSLISGQSVALSEIEKKWKEELDQELERKRQEIMRQAGLGSSPRDRGLSRQREKSKVCISGKMTYTKNLLVFLARLLRRR